MSLQTYPMISVVVPVYNAENYLENSIRHFLKQTYPNIEFVLVDDGSRDGSGKICDEYSLKESRIHVIHKANGGASDARNVGIDNTSGEYICFADSDDELNPDYVSNLYSDFIKCPDTVEESCIKDSEGKRPVRHSDNGLPWRGFGKHSGHRTSGVEDTPQGR